MIVLRRVRRICIGRSSKSDNAKPLRGFWVKKTAEKRDEHLHVAVTKESPSSSPGHHRSVQTTLPSAS